MRSIVLIFFISLLLLSPAFVHAQELGKGSGKETDSYYAALENYFQIPQADVADAVSQQVADDELPLLFFVAQRAGVDKGAVLNVRAGGLSWMQVAWHFKLNPSIFYTPVFLQTLKQTPYEASYHYYSSHSDKVKLSDIQLIDLAGLKFITEAYAYPPEEVVKLRAQGKTFREINDQTRREQARWDVEIPSDKPQVTPSSQSRHLGGHHHGGLSTMQTPTGN